MVLFYILFICTIVNFFYYAYSVKGVFKTYKSMDLLWYNLLKLFSVSTWLVCIYALLIHQNEFSNSSLLLCIALQIFSFYIFQKCRRLIRYRGLTLIFSKDKSEYILRVGPYKYIRHPFYFSYLLSYFSIAFLTSNIIVLIAAFLMLFIYTYAAIFEERKFKSSELRDRYIEYSKETGMFLPNPIKITRRLLKKTSNT